MWLSGRASERGIYGSEVRFLMKTQNLFSVPRSLEDEKHLSLFLNQAPISPSFLFHLFHFLCDGQWCMQSTDGAVGIMFYSKEGHRQLIMNINKFHF